MLSSEMNDFFLLIGNGNPTNGKGDWVLGLSSGEDRLSVRRTLPIREVLLVTEESQVSLVTLSFMMYYINQEKILLACACMSTIKGGKECTSMADSCQCMAKTATIL